MDELDDTIETWGEMFRHYAIPVDAYAELYQRAFDARQRKMNQGHECPTMDCTLLVSQWTGDNGLQKELREKARIAADRQLAQGGEPNPCDQCFGTGKKLFTGETCECVTEAKAA
jgi:hypothetical protein